MTIALPSLSNASERLVTTPAFSARKRTKATDVIGPVVPPALSSEPPKPPVLPAEPKSYDNRFGPGSLIINPSQPGLQAGTITRLTSRTEPAAPIVLTHNAARLLLGESFHGFHQALFQLRNPKFPPKALAPRFRRHGEPDPIALDQAEVARRRQFCLSHLPPEYRVETGGRILREDASTSKPGELRLQIAPLGPWSKRATAALTPLVDMVFPVNTPYPGSIPAANSSDVADTFKHVEALRGGVISGHVDTADIIKGLKASTGIDAVPLGQPITLALGNPPTDRPGETETIKAGIQRALAALAV